MSVFDHMAWAKAQKTGSIGRKAVLMALAERTGDEPTCFPSQARLAAELEAGERTVRRHLDDLEQMGLIESSRRYVNSWGEPLPRGRACNQYRLLLDDQPAKLAADPATTNRPTQVDQPAKPTRPTGQTDTTNRPPVAAEVPVLEPPLEAPSKIPATVVSEPSTPRLLEVPRPPAEARKMKGARRYSEGFERFWLRYPRKVDKLDAYRRWHTARRHVTDDDLVVACEAWADYWQAEGTEDRLIPHPATWLNKGRYETPPPARSRPSRTESQRRSDDVFTRFLAEDPARNPQTALEGALSASEVPSGSIPGNGVSEALAALLPSTARAT